MPKQESAQVAKSEDTPRPYSPQELKDRSKFADPAPVSTYASAKVALWAEYNAKYAPAFQTFRTDVGFAVLTLEQKGAKKLGVAKSAMKEARDKYIKIALAAFEEYIRGLTTAYAVDQVQNAKITQAIKQQLTKPGKKAAAKSKKVRKPKKRVKK